MNNAVIPAAIAEAAAEELSRRELLPFAARIVPGWMNSPHITLIAGLLEQVDRGETQTADREHAASALENSHL